MMRIKKEFIIKQIAGQWMVMNTNSKSLNFNKVIVLNGTGRFLWEKLQSGSESDALAASLTEHFEVDAETAQRDVEKFILQLKDLECIENEQ